MNDSQMFELICWLAFVLSAAETLWLEELDLNVSLQARASA